MPVLVPTTMCVSAPSSCHYTGTCSWPLQPLAPATTAAWLVSAGHNGNTEDPHCPCRLCKPAHRSHQGSQSCQWCGPQRPEAKRHRATSDLVLPHMVVLKPCNTRPRLTAHSSITRLQVELLPYQARPTGDLQMHRCLAKVTEIVKNQRLVTPLKEYRNLQGLNSDGNGDPGIACK